MIESQTILIPTASITVLENRRDISPEKVSEIAVSIAQRGLIHTVLINKETGALIAGAHRLMAFRHNAEHRIPCSHMDYLDWTLIPARYAYDVQEDELVALELEENLRRNELTWDEAAKSVRQYHDIRCKENDEWTLADTGRCLGLTDVSISRYIVVAREIEKGNTKVATASSLRSAYEIFSRQAGRAVATEMQIFNETESPSVTVYEKSVQVADFLSWLATYTGPKFNLLHCDFPYGINFHKSAAGGTAKWDGYKDSKDVYFALLTATLDNMDKILFPSAHIFFWFSMTYYSETIELFKQRDDLTFDPFPCIWHKTNKGIAPDASRYPRRSYEAAMLVSRGDRKLISMTDNVYAAPVSKEIHVSEKPESVLRHFFKMIVDDHTELLDPTCGSGTALRAAESLKAKRVVGLEINPQIAEEASLELDRARRLREAAKGVKV